MVADLRTAAEGTVVQKRIRIHALFQMDPTRLSCDNWQTAAARSIIAGIAFADLGDLGAVYARLREVAARGNLPRNIRIAQHLKVVQYENLSLIHILDVYKRQSPMRL